MARKLEDDVQRQVPSGLCSRAWNIVRPMVPEGTHICHGREMDGRALYIIQLTMTEQRGLGSSGTSGTTQQGLDKDSSQIRDAGRPADAMPRDALVDTTRTWWDKYSRWIVCALLGLLSVYIAPFFLEIYITVGICVGVWEYIKFQAEEETSKPIDAVPLFTYGSLQPGCIRLLRLLRCSCPYICCDVVHAALDTKLSPSFTALSYTWESQAPYRPMRISGRSFVVTPNVEAFLRAAQRAQLARQNQVDSERVDFLAANDLFWIDAVCINQMDDEERGVQVGMMRQLYECANSIAIWLGEPQARTRLAFDFLNRYKHGTPVIEVAEDEKGLTAQSLTDLLERSYWRRSWVLQEATTPKAAGLKMVLCGNLHVPLKSLLDVDAQKSLSSSHTGPLPRLVECYENVVMPLRTLTEARRSGGRGTLDADLHSLLQHVRRLEATDSRDKLFAPIQLAKEAQLYKPDYTVSEPEAYRQFGACLVAGTRCLDLLAHLGASAVPKDGGHWPSWIPDWREEAPVPFPREDLAASTYTLWHFARRDAPPTRQYTLPALPDRLQENLNAGKLLVLAIRIGTIDKRSGFDKENVETRLYGVTQEVKEQRALYTMKINKKIDECFRKHSATPPTDLQVLAPQTVNPGDGVYCVFGARYPLVLRDSSSKPRLKDQFGKYLDWHRPSSSASLSPSRSSEDLYSSTASFTVVGEAYCDQKSFFISDIHWGFFGGNKTSRFKNLGMKWLWGDRKLKFQWGLDKEYVSRVLLDKYGDPGLSISQLICELSIA